MRDAGTERFFGTSRFCHRPHPDRAPLAVPGPVGGTPQCQHVARIGTFEIGAPLWQYPSAGGWHFVSLPAEVSAEITEIAAGARRGFGSVRVDVTVGAISWRTSIFPDSRTGTYLLPMKKAVRVAEHLEAGDEVRALLQVADL